MDSYLAYNQSNLMDCFPGMVGYLDVKHQVKLLNKRALDMLGFKSLDDAIGKTSFDIPSRASECAEQYISQDCLVLEQEKPLQILDICEYSDCSIHAWLTTKSLVKNNEGSKLGVLYVSQELRLNNLNLILGQQDINSSQKKHALSYWIDDNNDCQRLSVRQKECLFYLIRGKSCHDIANILEISQRTVETHLNEIKHKFKCHTKADVIEKAIDTGMLYSIPRGLLKASFSQQLSKQLNSFTP